MTDSIDQRFHRNLRTMLVRPQSAYSWALAVWIVFLVSAMGLGALREGWIAPALGEQAAHVIGTLLFVTTMLAIMWPFVAKFRTTLLPRDLWLIGVMWTLMTLSFEFLFFHFVAGVPLETMLAEYNLFAGRLFERSFSCRWVDCSRWGC